MSDSSNPDVPPEAIGKWAKYFVSVAINLFLWICITLGFFIALLLGDKLGVVESLPRKVANVSKFFDEKFLFALLLGILLMVLFFKFLYDLCLKLRKQFDWWRGNRELVSDKKLHEHVQAEVFGQINSVANLSMFSGLAISADQGWIASRLLEESIVKPSYLMWTGGGLYLLAAFLYWIYAGD